MTHSGRIDGAAKQPVPRERAIYDGWIVVGASFLIALLSMGVQGSFGNFLKPMSAEFGWDRATVSLPAAVAILMNGFFQVGLITTHFVAFATDRGIAPTTAATALGLLGGFNIVGSLLAGTVSDRLGRKNPLALIYLVRGTAFAILLVADSAWMLYLFAALAGLAWFSTVPLTVSLTAEIYGVKHMGTLVGVVFASHQMGGALSIYLAGQLYDLSGSYTAITLMGIAFLLGAGLAGYAIQKQRYSAKYLGGGQGLIGVG